MFSNPKRVELNVSSGEIFNFNGTGLLDIHTDAINYWDTANDTDSIDNLPTYLWNKVEGETLNIKSTFDDDAMQTLTSNSLESICLSKRATNQHH